MGDELLYAITDIGDDLLEEAYGVSPTLFKAKHKRKKIALLWVAILSLLFCSFGVKGRGIFDPWIQNASSNPIETVRSALEAQKDKDYTISMQIVNICVDDAETTRTIKRLLGSELASKRGWTDNMISEHYVVVRADYHVEYDHTKTFQNDGDIVQFFHLLQREDGKWEIVDNSTDVSGLVKNGLGEGY